MLVLTRRIDESLIIDLSDSVDPNMTVGELFAGGSIEITVVGVYGLQARIGIAAPGALDILREELCGL